MLKFLKVWLVLLTAVLIFVVLFDRSDRFYFLISRPGFYPEEETRFYRVLGNNMDELERSVYHQPGRAVQDHDDYAPYHIVWRFSTRDEYGRCTIDKLRVEAHTEIILPKWNQEEGNTSVLGRRWRHYVENLAEHEEGHRRLTLDTAEAIYEALGRLGLEQTFNTCEELRGKANLLGNQMLAYLRERHERYDEKTMSGRTQGASMDLQQ